MDMYDVKRLALVYAVNAEIEGMKAENEIRKQLGHSMAYEGESFQEKAMELKNIAYLHNDQL